MRRNGDEWKKAPRWMKELHAWRAGRWARIVVITLPTRVSRELSHLHDPLPCGFAELRAGHLRSAS